MPVHVKKRVTEFGVNATYTDSSDKNSSRLFVKDAVSKRSYLIDSGSEISILPPLPGKKYTRSSLGYHFQLSAANGSAIRVYGTALLNINLGFPNKDLSWNFVVADVSKPIIGADFLEYYHLLPDLKSKKLIDGKTLLSTACYTQPSDFSSIHCVHYDHKNKRVADLLKTYRQLLLQPQYREKPPHNVVHHITTTGRPVYQKPRPLKHQTLKKVIAEFKKQEEQGILQASNSEWASPLVLIEKKGKLRIAGDYRLLNAQTVPDRYPVPNLHDSVQKLCNMKYFSKIDLVRAYHNIPIAVSDVPKTAIVSPAGLYEYKRMCFGLCNAPATWNRFINSILSDLPFVFVYFDDILIYSITEEEQYKNIEIVFNRLSEHGLTINPEKCEFVVPEIDFLGHKISNRGFLPTDERVREIKNIEKPHTIKQLRRCLGILNFY